MKTLTTLVKIAKQELDEKRKELSVYLDKKDEILAQKQQLEKDLLKEQEFASISNEASFAYTAFAVNIGVKQENIDKFFDVLNQQIEALSLEVTEKFAELKRYEIMLDKKLQEEKKERLRKETIALDEIGINLHLRKNEE